MQEKNISEYADTRQHLNCSIISPHRRLPHALAHKTQIKGKKEKKESRDFPEARRPLRARASRLSSTCVSYTCTSRTRAPPVTLRVLHTHSCSASQQLSSRAARTRASRTRAPLVHVHLSYTCTSRDSPGTPHTARPLRALFHTASISTSAFPHTASISTSAFSTRLLRTASRPLLRTLAFSHTSAFQTRLLSSAPDLFFVRHPLSSL